MLPFYKIVVNPDDETGVDFNAFVDAPAHMKSFIAFGKDQVRYSFNDEKRIVTGVMISVGTPIYRRDEEFGEHYVVFDSETVDLIRKKFFKQGFQQNLNADHDPDKVINGATLIESYTISSTNPKFPTAPEAFADMNLQDGTWIASYYVEDEKIWNGVKDGTFTGFSVEGWFDKVKINIKQNHSTMKIAKFDTQVSQISKYNITVDDTEIKIGARLNYVDVNGDKVPVVSGEYLTRNDERILVDADGIIQKIGFTKTNKSKMAEKKEKLWETVKALFSDTEEKGTEENKPKFAQATTADGTVVMYDGELGEGTLLFIESTEGEETVQLPAPEGDHQLTLEDGSTKLVVVDGTGAVVSVEDFNKEEVEDTELRSEVAEAITEMAKQLKADFAKQLKTVTDKNTKLEREVEALKSGEKFKAKPKGSAGKEEGKLSSSQLLKQSNK